MHFYIQTLNIVKSYVPLRIIYKQKTKDALEINKKYLHNKFLFSKYFCMLDRALQLLNFICKNAHSASVGL